MTNHFHYYFNSINNYFYENYGHFYLCLDFYLKIIFNLDINLFRSNVFDFKHPPACKFYTQPNVQ